ncbi:MAG: iron transporter [Microbacteriaceae bacterium]|nr:iron transporter [Microbacteriaceae bacterium]
MTAPVITRTGDGEQAEGVRAVRAARRARGRRSTIVVAVLASLGLAIAAVSLCVGAYTIGVPRVVLALLGLGDEGDSFVVLQLRAPRLVLGILTAVAFATAGALFQSVLRNPLASPDLIGVSGGASFAAVFAILVLGWSGVAVSALAFLGALTVAAAIYLLASRGGLSGFRFVLIGIAVAFMVTAALNFLITRADVTDARVAIVWLVGSLGGARWAEIVTVAVALAVLLPLTAIVAPRLRILQLGDDSATGLGVPAARARLVLIALAVALVAVGTAAAGPIAFVAFVSAPIARRLVGTGGLSLVPSALVGVVVVTASDFVAQHALGAVQVPVGVVTGVVGAPYLLWLLGTAGRSRGGD